MDPLKLENQLCFPLYAAARGIVKLYTPFLAEVGLTYTQYITMMVLWERRQVGVKELGAALYLDSGTLTPLLKKLEKQGLLTRARSAQDERHLVVTAPADAEGPFQPPRLSLVSLPYALGKGAPLAFVGAGPGGDRSPEQAVAALEDRHLRPERPPGCRAWA